MKRLPITLSLATLDFSVTITSSYKLQVTPMLYVTRDMLISDRGAI